VATGHYARIGHDGGRYRLFRGLDQAKDQSYFLYGLGQEQLAHVRFPLGEMSKPQVRAAARAMGLATADKREQPGDLLRSARRLPGRPARASRLEGRTGSVA